MGCEDRRYESAEDTAERERWAAENDGPIAHTVPPFNPDLDLYDDCNLEMGHQDRG